MPSRAIRNPTPSEGTPAIRSRRIAAGSVLLLGFGVLLMGGLFHSSHRALAIVLGLILAAISLVYLGIELLLRLAVRSVQQRRLGGD